MRSALSVKDLHGALICSMGTSVTRHSDLAKKPLEIDLLPPRPAHILVYMYNLGNPPGGRGGRNEHKIVVRVPGQPFRRAFFDTSGNRYPFLVGYRADIDVFVLWDIFLHPSVGYASNFQVRGKTVFDGLRLGVAEQSRKLRSGAIEVVIACRGVSLLEALDLRIKRSLERLCGS